MQKLSNEYGFTDTNYLELCNAELPLHDGYTTDISAKLYTETSKILCRSSETCT
ncbi:hypothetical protein XCR1_2700006 [Xenorhabdus cabanillasii JM26]|uniref:Uncharacterized protein n=1 Tax=Xenorhabdus cabanillasii JM26 TaxID=1427517 RepID=W1J5N1_9GAMM|nr:hypothetical protein XCR1_2700006 [Xenorhabdus cabanillasii JM26]